MGASGPYTIVCLSSQSWHDGMWTNKQHVMSRLARRHRVLHVDFGPLPLRSLWGRKLRSGALRPVPGALLAPHVEASDGLTQLAFWAPARGLSRLSAGHPLRRAAEFELRLALLRRYLRREGVHDPILWVYHPGYGDAAARIPHRLLVYDCVDEYAAFPAYRDDPAWLREREAALCRAADVVFTSSAPLQAAKRVHRPGDTHLVPNVGDAEHFAAAREPDVALPVELRALPRPVLGFVGAVSGYKLDTAWLVALARRRPDASLVLVGPAGHADPGTDLAPLAALPNVHLVGHRPYAELPAWLAGFDVCLLPYRRNAYTDACFPIKFFEYLASGRPVVTSALPALAEHFGAVRVARDADGFVAQCEAALREPDAGRDARVELARRHTWEHRVAALWGHVEAKLAAVAAP